MEHEHPDHLLVIDGLNLVRPIYEVNPAEDSPEKIEKVIKNSLASIRRALNEIQPTHVLVAFDYGGHTWRHDLYAHYRKSRKPMPQILRDALPTLYAELDDMGIRNISVQGVEADDIIGTVVPHWVRCKPGAKVTVISTDKDLSVLIALGAAIRDHFNSIWRGEEWVVNKFGVKPAQMHDLLALMGDSSDDIPGVDGVAVKTAAKWLNAYGTLDNVIANAAEIKGKVGENLRASIDLVRLSRKLVDFKTDLSLGLTWNALRYREAQPA
jgi:protein Xni